MDMKNHIEFEIVKNERTYRFCMPAGAPFGEIYDAAFEVLTEVTRLAQDAAEKAKPKELTEGQ
jgi:hypothetical protein